MLDGQPFSDLEMNVFSNLFLDYSILGCMPAVVRDYLLKETFEGSLQTQREIMGITGRICESMPRDSIRCASLTFLTV